MALLLDKAMLAADNAFVARVKAAMVEAAASILAELKPMDAPGAARWRLAGQVLTDLDRTASLFIMAVAVSDQIADASKTTNGVTDTMIRQRVLAVWPYLANE